MGMLHFMGPGASHWHARAGSVQAWKRRSGLVMYTRLMVRLFSFVSMVVGSLVIVSSPWIGLLRLRRPALRRARRARRAVRPRTCCNEPARTWRPAAARP